MTNIDLHSISKGIGLRDEDSLVQAAILHGDLDPSIAPGKAAPIGSLYMRTNTSSPELYQKIGPTDTNWQQVNVSNSTGANTIPVVQLRRSATQAMPNNFTDLNFDITDMETDPTIIEHDTINIDRVLIKETGLYGIAFSLSIDANPNENYFNIRVRINDNTVIPISNREISEDDEVNACSNTFFTELSAGDFISMQIKSDGNGDVLYNTSNMIVWKASGPKGEQGPPGSGSTILVSENGANIPNTPNTELDFTGNVNVSDGGSGKAIINIPAPVFGSEFHYSEDLGITTTSTNQYITKNTLTVNVPAGTYRIGISYGWNYNSTTRDIEVRLMEDSIQVRYPHRQEPKDSAGSFSTTGSNQKHYTTRTFYRTLTTGSHTFELQFRSTASGINASLWDTVIEFWRVS